MRHPLDAARAVQGKVDGAGRAFVGLLVHSAADGFAVGAACVGGSSALSSAVALAMVLHKARGARMPQAVSHAAT